MPSKRYIINVAPVAHMNGKLAPTSDIVHDNPTSSDAGGVSYFYGYRRGDRLRSRFGLRTKARNLSVNPYTAEESANRDLFRESIIAADTALQDATKKAAATAAFRRQKKYISLRNYCIALTVKNGGVFPF